MFFKKLLGQALPNEQVGGGCGPSSGLAIFREQVEGARLSREGGSCLPSFQAALLLGVGGPGSAVAETLNRSWGPPGEQHSQWREPGAGGGD